MIPALHPDSESAFWTIPDPDLDPVKSRIITPLVFELVLCYANVGLKIGNVVSPFRQRGPRRPRSTGTRGGRRGTHFSATTTPREGSGMMGKRPAKRGLLSMVLVWAGSNLTTTLDCVGSLKSGSYGNFYIQRSRIPSLLAKKPEKNKDFGILLWLLLLFLKVTGVLGSRFSGSGTAIVLVS